MQNIPEPANISDGHKNQDKLLPFSYIYLPKVAPDSNLTVLSALLTLILVANSIGETIRIRLRAPLLLSTIASFFQNGVSP